MASKKLYEEFSDNFLTCHICLHEYEDPRVLPCYHTFCLACLAQHVAAKGTGGNITCPVCRQEAPVPPGGLEKLVRNFFLSKVKDFMLTTEKKDQMCGNCHSQVAQFYCQDCKHFFCENCRQKQHDAIKFLRGHTMISVSDHDKQVQEEMDARLFCDKHKGQQLIFYCTDDDVVVCRDCILTKHNKHNCVDIADVAEINKEKINSAFNDVSMNIELFEEAESEISKQQRATAGVVNKIVADIQQQEADIIKEVQRISAQLIAEAKDHAARHMKSLEAEKDRVQLQRVSVHSTCEFAKQLVQHGSHTEVMTYAKNIQAMMKELNNVRPTVQVKTIEITFSKGKLPVDFFGRVKKLEWLDAESLVDEFDSSMDDVWDISCSQRGTIYSISNWPGKITAISPSHEVIFQVDEQGTRCVTVLSDDRLVDNNGHILVCDNINKCICVYDAVQYNLINKIGIPMCYTPQCIAVLPCRDTIVVCDSDGHCVYGVTPQGDVVFQYGTPGEGGSGDGYLEYPESVCTDSMGHIFIADQNNGRVVVLTSDGQLLRYVVGLQQISIPLGMTIDNKGQLVVGDDKGKVKTYRYVS